MQIDGPINQVPKVGPITAKKLSKLGIKSVYDLLLHTPFRYEDRRIISNTAKSKINEVVSLIGNLSKISNTYTKNGKIIQTATFTDSHGTLDCIWFNQRYLSTTVDTPKKVALHGKIGFMGKKKCLISPEIEIIIDSPQTVEKIVPIYPQTAGISSKYIRSLIARVLANSQVKYPETQVLISQDLPDTKNSLINIHDPISLPIHPKYHDRLAIDELLIYKWQSRIRRDQWHLKHHSKKINVSSEKLSLYKSSLDFKLTSSQQIAIDEILSDISNNHAMNRILVGDVGSGKTVVAAAAVFASHQNGYKSLILAPTQILANQHYHTFTKLLEPLGASTGLITSSTKKIPQNASVIVGTHALLNQQEIINSPDVGMLIIDEQHRFGVAQRGLLSSAVSCPHTLSMSATPIPRTVALIKYGELQISTLTDMPQGRKPVKTWVVADSKRKGALDWIKNQIENEKTQVFIVCPYIESENEISEQKTVKVVYDQITSVCINQKTEMLHGKMKSSIKDEIIKKFREKQIDILVTTSVIEVGVDIPGANIIVVEQAHLFGLAQLHQLRGRVGRNDKQAYCLLFSDQENERLNILAKTHSGQELAEADFRLRGSGDMQGTAQHGVAQFRYASFEHLRFLPAIEDTVNSNFANLNRYPVLKKLIETDKISLVQPN